ncbi:MAG: type II toxin-antitoxin system Phd/YefM family antitoxin [Chloroflexi bacterium]|nr:type II toxin-antitoxin system Phd/YefM family antitoxin [Chloroflexota bacterium]
MKRIPTEEAKEQFLQLIDQLDDEGFVITRDGEPVARLTKYPNRFAKYIGSMKDEIKVHGDIINVGDRWVKGRQW